MDDIITYDIDDICLKKNTYYSTNFYDRTYARFKDILDKYECFSSVEFLINCKQIHDSKSNVSTSTNNQYSNTNRKHHHNYNNSNNRINTKKQNNISRPVHQFTCDDKMSNIVRDSLNKLSKNNYNKICIKIYLQSDVSNISSTIDTILSTSFQSKVYNDLYVSLIFYIFDKTVEQNIKQTIITQFNSCIKYMMSIEAYEIVDIPNETYDYFCERVKRHNNILSKFKSIMFIFQHDTIRELLNIKQIDFCNNVINMISNAHDLNLLTYIIVIECIKECFSINNEVIFKSSQDIPWKKMIDLKNINLEILNDFIWRESDSNNYKLKFKCIDLKETLETYLKNVT